MQNKLTKAERKLNRFHNHEIAENDVLVARELTKTYFQGEYHIKAVDNAFLRVKRGEFVSIVGTSGSGKSTLLHMLAGLDTPTSGQVFLDGYDIRAMDDDQFSDFRSRKIGLSSNRFIFCPS